jgi:hypothetical protein
MYPGGFGGGSDEPTEEYLAWERKLNAVARENLENLKALRKYSEMDRNGELTDEAKRITGVEKIDRLNEIDDAIVANSPISFMYNGKERTGRPIKMYDNKAKGTTNVVVESLDSKEQKTYTVDKMDPMPSAPEAEKAIDEPSASKKPSVDEIQSAIDAGEEISFVYNGKKRTITPEGMWENPKTGVTNVYGMDKDAGEKRTYTIEKMDAVPEATPKAELAPTEVKPIKDGDIESLKAQVQSAIDTGETIAFDYNDKPRVFTPERIYFNPKNGNTNVAGYSHTDGEERTFAIDNMSPPSGPIEPPAAEPAVVLTPTP